MNYITCCCCCCCCCLSCSKRPYRFFHYITLNHAIQIYSSPHQHASPYITLNYNIMQSDTINYIILYCIMIYGGTFYYMVMSCIAFIKLYSILFDSILFYSCLLCVNYRHLGPNGRGMAACLFRPRGGNMEFEALRCYDVKHSMRGPVCRPTHALFFFRKTSILIAVLRVWAHPACLHSVLDGTCL